MSEDIILEDIPKFIKRYSDQTIEGSNNTLIALGTDRPSTTDSGLGVTDSEDNGKKSGTVHIIAGRDKEDPNFVKDNAFIYVTMKSDLDVNLGLNIEGKDRGSGIVLKSDHLRLVGRKNIKIVLNDKNFIYFDGDKIIINFNDNVIRLEENNIQMNVGQSNIKLNKDGNINLKNSECGININNSEIVASGPLFKIGGKASNQWIGLLNSILAVATNHVHMTPVGPTSPAGVTNPGASSSISTITPLIPNSPILQSIVETIKSLETSCFENVS